MRHLLCLLALVLGCASAAMSQDTLSTAPKLPAHKRHRMGLWGELGSGPGYVRIACSGCADVIGASGTTTYFRIGGSISRNVLIGFEVFGFLDNSFGFGSDTNTVAETGTAAIVILWYPGRTGLFFKGGVGAAFGTFSIPADTGAGGPVVADTSTGGGMGITFGLGWDIAISRKFAFNVNATSFVTAGARAWVRCLPAPLLGPSPVIRTEKWLLKYSG